MSSREVRIIDAGNCDTGGSYTVVTGERVVIGHSDKLDNGLLPARDTAAGLAGLFFSWRRACPTLSDSQVVADLIRRGLIPGHGPDES